MNFEFKSEFLNESHRSMIGVHLVNHCSSLRKRLQRPSGLELQDLKFIDHPPKNDEPHFYEDDPAFPIGNPIKSIKCIKPNG